LASTFLKRAYRRPLLRKTHASKKQAFTKGKAAWKNKQKREGRGPKKRGGSTSNGQTRQKSRQKTALAPRSARGDQQKNGKGDRSQYVTPMRSAKEKDSKKRW